MCIDVLCTNQQLFSHVRTIFCLPGLNQTKQRIKCLAKGHNTVTQVSL